MAKKKRSPIQVRAAKFQEIPLIEEMCREAHARSKYNAFATVDEKQMANVLLQMIGGHGATGPGAAHVLVAERRSNGEIDGVIVGYCSTLYQGLDAHLVTDLLFYTKENAHADSAWMLLRGVRRWAEAMSADGPIVLRHGVVDSIGPADRAAKILKRTGMERVGFIYERLIEKGEMT